MAAEQDNKAQSALTVDLHTQYMQVDVVKTMHKRKHIALLVTDKIVKRDTFNGTCKLNRKSTSSGSEFLRYVQEKVISNTHA